MQKDGGFSSLRVKTVDGSGELRTVWELSDYSIFADSDWMIGEVQVDARSVIFEVYDTILLATKVLTRFLRALENAHLV